MSSLFSRPLKYTLILLCAIFLNQGCAGGGDSNPESVNENGQNISQTSRPQLAPTTFYPEAVTLKEVSNSDMKELLDEELVYIDAQELEWIAPKGTLTDGASVPRLALWVTDGRFDAGFLKAAIIHDAYCQSENADRCPAQFKKRPWKLVHRMFYEASVAGGTDQMRAKLMFAAVWLGGPRWNDIKNNLDEIPQASLIETYEFARLWIESEDPSIEEIELWMEEQETRLLESSALLPL